uniref:Ig-like domain-containing protein n=1 Tax=Leptobrachium leishanense TaxID=445787 RepID=A0A8C5PL63_9ANUR
MFLEVNWIFTFSFVLIFFSNVYSGFTDTPKLTVSQPQHISTNMGLSTTINCSFTISDGTDPLWTGVYWRVGNPTGDYAYHPSRDMIHPTYRGRTDLTGQTDLHIKNVQGTDYNTYYCMVILRECVGLNKVDTDIVQGRGTSLSVTGNLTYTVCHTMLHHKSKNQYNLSPGAS